MIVETVNRLNVEHRTSNIEHPMFDVHQYLFSIKLIAIVTIGLDDT